MAVPTKTGGNTGAVHAVDGIAETGHHRMELLREIVVGVHPQAAGVPHLYPTQKIMEDMVL